jgi:[ribosomal protein S18]-alanine N-acetyltransferase
MELVIREIREEDIAACLEIVPQIEPWLTLGSTPEVMRSYFQERLQKGEGFVALLREEVVGFVTIKNDFLHGSYIRRIAVKEECRGGGIGRRIMELIEKRVFDHDPNIFVCVSSSNPRARKFYKDLGYHQVGKLPNLIQKGEIEYLLRKEREHS